MRKILDCSKLLTAIVFGGALPWVRSWLAAGVAPSAAVWQPLKVQFVVKILCTASQRSCVSSSWLYASNDTCVLAGQRVLHSQVGRLIHCRPSRRVNDQHLIIGKIHTGPGIPKAESIDEFSISRGSNGDRMLNDDCFTAFRTDLNPNRMLAAPNNA